ncbi:unnamed protein product [Closterium sp. NIES-54]
MQHLRSRGASFSEILAARALLSSPPTPYGPFYSLPSVCPASLLWSPALSPQLPTMHLSTCSHAWLRNARAKGQARQLQLVRQQQQHQARHQQQEEERQHQQRERLQEQQQQQQRQSGRI